MHSDACLYVYYIIIIIIIIIIFRNATIPIFQIQNYPENSEYRPITIQSQCS